MAEERREATSLDSEGGKEMNITEAIAKLDVIDILAHLYLKMKDENVKDTVWRDPLTNEMIYVEITEGGR